MDVIADKTLRTLGFHIYITRHLKEKSSSFIDIMYFELTAEPAVVVNPGQVITDSEEKVVKKKNERTAKKKEWLANLHAPVGSPSSFCLQFSSLLLFGFILAPVLALVPTPMPTLIPGFLPSLMSAPVSCSR